MTRLNRFVFLNGDELVNITNKKRLPRDASEDELGGSLFLEGQERACVEDYLFRSPSIFEIKLVTTWTCNLRCSHCFVLHQLVKKDSGSIDEDALCRFLESYLSSFPSLKKGRIQFVGGETALTARQNVKIIRMVREVCSSRGLPMKFHSNTNCLDLDDDIIEYYSELTDLTVSLDGPKHMHDRQRKALDDKGSPFDRTVSNISRLIEMGMRDKIQVQASVPDEGANEKDIRSFYKVLLMHGVKMENILYNLSVPTKTHDPGERFKIARQNPFPMPCCKYRWMSDFTVCTDNKIYSEYFDVVEENALGRIDDPIDEIAERHKSLILKTMPVLHDPKCQTCPVIGLCWGNCCNTYRIHKPSEICDADGLHKRTSAAAARGELFSFVNNNRSKTY